MIVPHEDPSLEEVLVVHHAAPEEEAGEERDACRDAFRHDLVPSTDDAVWWADSDGLAACLASARASTRMVNVAVVFLGMTMGAALVLVGHSYHDNDQRLLPFHLFSNSQDARRAHSVSGIPLSDGQGVAWGAFSPPRITTVGDAARMLSLATAGKPWTEVCRIYKHITGEQAHPMPCPEAIEVKGWFAHAPMGGQSSLSKYMLDSETGDPGQSDMCREPTHALMPVMHINV